MLHDVVRNISFPDRGLRSVGLQRMRRTHGVLHALSAFALGMLIGAGLAVLLAPISEPEMRKRVRERVNGDREPIPAR